MTDKNKKILNGMKEISAYVGKTEATVLKLHREYDLPMKKVAGCWMSHAESIDNWLKDLVG